MERSRTLFKIIAWILLGSMSIGCQHLSSSAYSVKVVNEQGEPVPEANVHVRLDELEFLRPAIFGEWEPLRVRPDGRVRIPGKVVLNDATWGEWIVYLYVQAPGYEDQELVAAKYEKLSSTVKPRWIYPLKETATIVLRSKE